MLVDLRSDRRSQQCGYLIGTGDPVLYGIMVHIALAARNPPFGTAIFVTTAPVRKVRLYTLDALDHSVLTSCFKIRPLLLHSNKANAGAGAVLAKLRRHPGITQKSDAALVEEVSGTHYVVHVSDTGGYLFR